MLNLTYQSSRYNIRVENRSSVDRTFVRRRFDDTVPSIALICICIYHLKEYQIRI